MSNETKKLYAERDAMELDQIGGHYFKHVMAMTSEALHSKSDIAAELGWRDCQIEQLEQQLAESQSKLAQMAAENACLKLNLQGTAEFCYSELPETPATDAYLAEVRASGVEMLAEHLSGMSISASETSVREFAAQLRQGGAE